ncbi:MAG: hypothetical protein COA79_03545 [Planctomycetota bacterium]|nr:MAG: hypothetical protein COA79_03545 [Planctomycetota bacterium]
MATFKTILIVICMCLNLSLMSDEIKLKDNTFFKGKIKKATSEGIYFQVEGLDKVILIKWSKIDKDSAEILKKKLDIKKEEPKSKEKPAVVKPAKRKIKKSKLLKPVPLDASAKYKISLARVHIDFNNSEDAKPLLESAENTVSNPDEKRNLYSTFAYYHKKNKQPGKASEYLIKRLEIAHDERDKGYTLRELIPELIKSGDYDLAEKHCLVYLDMFEDGYDLSNAINNLVKIHVKKGDIDDFERKIEALLNSDKNNFKNLCIVLKIYMRRDKPQSKKAISTLETLISIKEKNTWYKKVLSDLYYRTQDFEKAIILTEELFKLQDRDKNHYIRRLVDLYKKIEQPETAFAWLNKIENKGSRNIIYKANVLKDMKKRDEARKLIEDGINDSDKYKDKVQLKFHLAGIERNEKNYNSALDVYKGIISNDKSSSKNKNHAKKGLFDTLNQAGMLDKVQISIDED